MNSLKVTIDADKNLITVYNNGDGIPVKYHRKEKVYVPELIFENLYTSSNYDGIIKTIGRNGVGAKISNIFSTHFMVETADGENLYTQEFSNNMEEKSNPTIRKCNSGENWTKISFQPDLSKFGMECLEADVVALMKKRVVDIAGCLGKSVRVELDGNHVPLETFEDYVKLYLKSSQERMYEKVSKRWEICVSMADGHFKQTSFVNNIATIKGGTHVDYITNQIANHLVAVVKKQNKHSKLEAHNVKKYLWVFVNALIDNPTFESIAKEFLNIEQSSFGTTCELTADFLRKVGRSDFVGNAISWVQSQLQHNDLKKADGDSAMNTVISALTTRGQDWYGVYPLKGKLPNVRKATVAGVLQSVEIKNIVEILGLKPGKEYADAKHLRYGHLMMMTDQDHDGSHIKGLILNLFHFYWPSLLKVPKFLQVLITPIYKVTNELSKCVDHFYTIHEYEKWKKSLGNNEEEYKIKGWDEVVLMNVLCSGYLNNFDKYRKDFVWVNCQDDEAIVLAFCRNKVEERKQRLLQLQAEEVGTYCVLKEKNIRIHDFIHRELFPYSLASLQRSVPSIIDGLKPSQRKILFCAFKNAIDKEVNVDDFSGYVSDLSAYRHGRETLVGTIIGMAQNSVGSNNINLLDPIGQFGTRRRGGKEHSVARYIFTKLTPITRLLFHETDDLLLNYLHEDGKIIEPSWYVPIIPMILVNGTEGVGTGWKTSVPKYNPSDIIANLRHLLNGEEIVSMEPWYKGFEGDITKE